MSGQTKSWTIEEMLAEEPRYSHRKIKRLFAGRTKLTLLEILDLKIPAEDKIWCATLEKALAPKLLSILAQKASKRANDYVDIQVAKNCRGPWAEQWLSGEDRSRSSVYEELGRYQPEKGRPTVARAFDAATTKQQAGKDNKLALFCAALCFPSLKKEFEQQVEDLRQLLTK